MARKYRYRYLVVIEKGSLPLLQKLSGALGFINNTPGAKQGDSSPGDFFDSLAEHFEAQPTRVLAAMSGLGIVGTEASPHPYPLVPDP